MQALEETDLRVEHDERVPVRPALALPGLQGGMGYGSDGQEENLMGPLMLVDWWCPKCTAHELTPVNAVKRKTTCRQCRRKMEIEKGREWQARKRKERLGL